MNDPTVLESFSAAAHHKSIYLIYLFIYLLFFLIILIFFFSFEFHSQFFSLLFYSQNNNNNNNNDNNKNKNNSNNNKIGFVHQMRIQWGFANMIGQSKQIGWKWGETTGLTDTIIKPLLTGEMDDDPLGMLSLFPNLLLLCENSEASVKLDESGAFKRLETLLFGVYIFEFFFFYYYFCGDICSLSFLVFLLSFSLPFSFLFYKKYYY